MTQSPDYARRSQATREHLQAAAHKVLIERGYSGASTLRIQQEAGMSRGRLLHQYPNRDELLLAAAQHVTDVSIQATQVEVEVPDDSVEMICAAVDRVWDTYHEGYFWAAVELWLAARHNGHLREALVPAEHQTNRAVLDAIAGLFGPLAHHSNFPRTRELLNTSMRGVALTYAFEPRDHRRDPHIPLWRDLAIEMLTD